MSSTTFPPGAPTGDLPCWWVFTRAAPTTGRGLALQLSSHLVNHSLLPRLGSDAKPPAEAWVSLAVNPPPPGESLRCLAGGFPRPGHRALGLRQASDPWRGGARGAAAVGAGGGRAQPPRCGFGWAAPACWLPTASLWSLWETSGALPYTAFVTFIQPWCI